MGLKHMLGLGLVLKPSPNPNPKFLNHLDVLE